VTVRQSDRYHHLAMRRWRAEMRAADALQEETPVAPSVMTDRAVADALEDAAGSLAETAGNGDLAELLDEAARRLRERA
jgi:hypothetical protein